MGGIMSGTLTIKTYLVPTTVGAHSGTITITSDAASSPDSVSTAGTSIYDSEEVEIPQLEIFDTEKLQVKYYTWDVIMDVRLDYISKVVFGDYDHVEDLVNANLHLGLDIFKDYFIPAGTLLRIPVLEDTKITEEINNALPAWRQE
jgi:hypothetical protein